MMSSSLEMVSKLQATSSADTKTAKKQGRVLVAEDAHCIQMILGAILRKMNMRVDMADNGQAACDKAMASLAEGQPYDIILMDMQMPKMNGCQAARWLRDHQWEGPIIAVSIHSTDREHEEFKKAGFNDFLSKPVNESDLKQVLNPFLDPGALPRPLANVSIRG